MATAPLLPDPDASESSDHLAVEDHETLMRRLLKRLAEYNRDKTPPLQGGAFHPTKRDTDGLSLNRRLSDQFASFLEPSDLKNWHQVPEGIRDTCGLVAVLAKQARDLGLTVEPDPASTPGHVLIKEINWEEFAGDGHTDISRTESSAGHSNSRSSLLFSSNPARRGQAIPLCDRS